MKNLKNFQSFNEGRGRIELVDNFVVAGDVNLPQTYDPKKSQETNIDMKSFIMSSSNSYNFLNDIDDDLSDDDISKFISPHIKKFNDFGFDPSKH